MQLADNDTDVVDLHETFASSGSSPFNRRVENPKNPAQSRVSVSKMCTNTCFTSVVWLQKCSKHHVVNEKDFLPRKNYSNKGQCEGSLKT